MGKMPCKVASQTEVNSQQLHSLYFTLESLSSTSVIIVQEQKMLSAVEETSTVLETPHGQSMLLSPSVQAYKASPMLPTNMPKELQLLVLEHCLSSASPIINAGKVRDVMLYLVANEKRGQEDLSHPIVVTCEEYCQEGLRILYSRNLFLYLPIMRLPQLPYRGDKDLRRSLQDLATFSHDILEDRIAQFQNLLHCRLCFQQRRSGHFTMIRNVPKIARAPGQYVNLLQGYRHH